MRQDGALDRAARILLLGWLPARVWLDLAHGIAGGGAVARVLTALFSGIALALAFRVLLQGPHPLRLAFGIFVAAVGLGIARSELALHGSVGLALLYLGPVAYGIAVGGWLGRPGDPRRVLGATALAAGLPLVWTAQAWLTGDLGPELHGYRRLIGPYTSHHALAVAMLLFAVLGTWFAAGRQPWAVRIGGAALATLSLAAMGATLVRTTALWALIAAAVALAVQRRWVLLGIGAVAGVLAGLVSPVLQERASDLWAVLTATPPPEGWGAIGSYRIYIWTESWSAFVAQGPAAVLLGLGLGAHQTLHKNLDPHQEYLTLWFQLGLPGLVAYVAMLGIAAREAARRLGGPGHEVALLALAALIAVGLTNALSNDFLPRPVLAFAVWGIAGLAYAAPEGPPESSGS